MRADYNVEPVATAVHRRLGRNVWVCFPILVRSIFAGPSRRLAHCGGISATLGGVSGAVVSSSGGGTGSVASPG